MNTTLWIRLQLQALSFNSFVLRPNRHSHSSLLSTIERWLWLTWLKREFIALWFIKRDMTITTIPDKTYVNFKIEIEPVHIATFFYAKSMAFASRKLPT